MANKNIDMHKDYFNGKGYYLIEKDNHLCYRWKRWQKVPTFLFGRRNRIEKRRQNRKLQKYSSSFRSPYV